MPNERPSTPNIIPGYRILKKIGQGGMGAVYLAQQTSMDRLVARKVLPKSLAKQKEFKERFFREARAAGKLNHPNIVTAIDAQEAAGYCYIAMEYVKGRTVSSMLHQRGSLSEGEALSIGHQIASALAHAWEAGIVHRDVKPENFLCTKEGVAKLCDLGIAKAPSDAGLTQDGTALGTPRYIAPEQARGLETVDYRADIYSLGASLYHMLSGVPPFDGPTGPAIMLKHVNESLPSLKKRAPHVSRGTVQVVERMLAKDPAKRYQKPDDLLADLNAVREGKAPPTAGSPRRPSGRLPAARRPAPGAARTVVTRTAPRGSDSSKYVLALVFVLAAGVTFVLWPKPPPPSRPSPDPSAPPSSSDLEEQARRAFAEAKQLYTDGHIQRAHDALRDLIQRYPNTSYIPLAEARLKEVRAEINAAARLERAKAALEGLRAKKATLDENAYIEALRAFAKDPKHAGHPADSALSEANRLAEAQALTAPQPQPPPPEDLDTLVAKAKETLAGADWQRTERILNLVLQRGKELAPLVPDIRKLAASAPPAAVRGKSLKALAAAAPAQADAVATAQLTDRNEAVRLAAIEHLSKRRLPGAIPHLERLIKDGPSRDPSPRVLAAAEAALQHIRRP